MAWTDEKKAEVIQAYEELEPTPENSVELVKQIAEDFDESPNGVRMILSKAGVYVKKAASESGKGAASGEKKASTRVSKQDAQDALTEVIKESGAEPDEDIISKLTGKAAQYFTEVLKASLGQNEED